MRQELCPHNPDSPIPVERTGNLQFQRALDFEITSNDATQGRLQKKLNMASPDDV